MSSTNHARHAFFYVLILIALGFLAIGAGQVLFTLIEHFFPETTSYNYLGENSMLRFGLASIFVGAPVFYFLTRTINTDLANKALTPDSGIRRWLTYFVLLVAASTALGDLVTTFYSFLSGELTLRFLLKALTILALAGSVLAYYTYDLTRKQFVRDNVLHGINVAFIIAVITILGAGISINTSPSQARLILEDTRRIEMLTALTGTIDTFYEKQVKLPTSLNALVENKTLFAKDIQDPATQVAYEYRTLGGTKYELCAIFVTTAKDRGDGLWDAAWQHDAGRTCFAREVSSWALENVKKK